MITIDHLTKRYGPVIAVDGLSFEVGPGKVTGARRHAIWASIPGQAT
jgi:ABC-type uncharacterized transport system ATPase subunit